MPIKGLSDQCRMPRLGKIRLGRKAPNKSGEGEHPVATESFVLTPELAKIYGENCAELPIMIPTEDDDLWASQYYKRYSMTRGLVCRGDGVTCHRMVDVKTGAIADRTTTEIVWKEGLPCDGVNCPEYQAKPQRCKECMHLQFIMPDVPGLGVWQVDTSSVNSIRNINSAAKMVRFVYKRIAFIPLLLTLEPQIVVAEGKEKTVRCLNLRTRGTMRELMALAAKPYTELLLPFPVDSEPDDTSEEPQANEQDKKEVASTKADQAVKDDWPEEKKPEPETVKATPKTERVYNQPPTKGKSVSPCPSEANQQVSPAGGNGQQKSEPPKMKRDPATLKNLSAMVRACFDDFRMQPAEVLAELNVNSLPDITDTPATCYTRIFAIRGT